jgi:hypothetical protein
VRTRIQAYVVVRGIRRVRVLCAAALIQNLRHLHRTARPEPFDPPLILSLSKDERATTDDARTLRAGAASRGAALVVRAACDEQLAAAGRDESHHAERRRDSVPVAPAARALSGDVSSSRSIHARWYQRELFVCRCWLARRLRDAANADSDLDPDIRIAIPLYVRACSRCCLLFCHGELARLKPPPRYLTQFYLMMSLGGAHRRHRRRRRRTANLRRILGLGSG